MALTWFRKAAQFEDPVFSPPAEDAHAELSAAIANANAANKAALARCRDAARRGRGAGGRHGGVS